MKRRAIFLDRDGVLNEEVGYITEIAQLRLFDFAAEAVRLINESGRPAIVATNQAGVARGHFTEDFLAQLHAQMKLSLLQQGARLDAVYYCPHHPEFGGPPYLRDCDCRKPRPGMIERAAGDFDLDPNECFMIGDRYSDIEMGHAAGARSVIVMTGRGLEEYQTEHKLWPRQPDHVAENLLEAVKWILSIADCGLRIAD